MVLIKKIHGESVFQKADLDKIATLAEFEGFKKNTNHKQK